jgi:negative regulator of sigma E activity
MKLEIYDQENKLLFRGLDLDGMHAHNQKFDKQKPRVLKGGYFGFVNIHREKKDGNMERFLFTDGLSRFSVFRSPPDKRRNSEKLVVYGNYIYTVTTDNSSYTVVGSVPFSFMEDVVSKLDSNDKEFNTLINNK